MPEAIVRFAKRLLPGVWLVPNPRKQIFLTFDDGPIPVVTEWVLDLLKEQNIKATFFCVGENVQRHPAVYQRILDEGHAVGNHTHNHLNGWKTSRQAYLKNVSQASGLIQSRLFRPPHGKLRPMAHFLLSRQYRVIMWDVLARDYDRSLRPEDCLKNATTHVRSGSIIVFHDSLKAEANLRYALPRCIAYLREQGYVFARLAES